MPFLIVAVLFLAGCVTAESTSPSLERCIHVDTLPKDGFNAYVYRCHIETRTCLVVRDGHGLAMDCED